MNSLLEYFDEQYQNFESLICRDLNRLGFGLEIGVERLMQKISTMRSAELKNFLLQDLFADRDKVSKILDRAELKSLAQQLIELRSMQQCRSSVFRLGVVIPITLAFSFTALLIFGKQYKKIKSFLKYWLPQFIDSDRFFQKIKLARKCSRQWSTTLGFLAIFSSLMLDMVIAWINASVLLSWVIPRFSPWRRWLFLGISLPVDANMLKGFVTGNKPNSNEERSWSFDVGSILTLMLLRWICAKLDDMAAFQYSSFRSRSR